MYDFLPIFPQIIESTFGNVFFSSAQLNRDINWAQNCIIFFQSGLYWTEQLYRLLKPPNFLSISFKTQCCYLQREGAEPTALWVTRPTLQHPLQVKHNANPQWSLPEQQSYSEPFHEWKEHISWKEIYSNNVAIIFTHLRQRRHSSSFT